jgi:hypothetical protein
MLPDIPSPSSSSEDSVLESDDGIQPIIIATVDQSGVAADEKDVIADKRLRWSFWSTKNHAVTSSFPQQTSYIGRKQFLTREPQIPSESSLRVAQTT